MGTSSCKAVAFSEDGLTLAQKTYSYSPESPHPSWIEMSPEKFWRALLAVTRSIAADVTSDPVEVLAISSHGETFVPVDSHQCAIGPAILNADNRAVAEANGLPEAVGRACLVGIPGRAADRSLRLA